MPSLLQFFAITFFSAIFIACHSGEPKKSTAWNELHLDTSLIELHSIPASIRAIEAIDNMTCWFAGSKGFFGHTKDGGQNWNIDSLIHPEHGPLHFRSIAVTQDAVHILSIGSPALLYRSTDQGQGWDLVYEENDSLAFYDAMSFWDNTRGIVMGDPTEDCISIILSSDGGKTWSKIPCDQLPKAEKGEAAFAASNGNIALSGSNAWIVSGGKRSRVLHSPDYGQTWQVYNTPIVEGGTMTGIFSVDFFDDNTGIIMGGDWENKDNNYRNKAVTDDGGKTWKLIADGQLPGYRSSVQYLKDDNPNSIMAVGIPGISYSENGGKDWVQLSNEDWYTFRRADKVIWLAGNGKIGKWVLR